MRRSTALLAVAVSAACYATLAVLVRLAYDAGLQPLPLLAWRFALVAVLVGAVQMARSPRALAIGWRSASRFAVLALAGYGLGSISFFFALRYADASVVAVLLYAYPTFVTLIIAVAERRIPGRARVAALLATFAGCALVLDPLGGTGVRPLGVVLGVGAACGYAAFSYLSHKWMGPHPRLVLMTYVFAVSSALAGAAALVTGGTLSPETWPMSGWVLLGVIALVPTFAAVILYLEGIRRLGAAQAAIVSTFEPLFTIALASAVLGERMHPIQWVGAVLVVAGVIAGEAGERPGIEPAPV